MDKFRYRDVKVQILSSVSDAIDNLHLIHIVTNNRCNFNEYKLSHFFAKLTNIPIEINITEMLKFSCRDVQTGHLSVNICIAHLDINITYKNVGRTSMDNITQVKHSK